MPPEKKDVSPPGNPGVPMVQVNRRVITWTPEGMPVPTSVPALTRQGVEELAITAMSLPFEPPDVPEYLPEGSKEREVAQYERDKEMEFVGMTNAEVIAVKMARMAASGDKEAIRELWDRTLGRPKQSVESKSVRMTYEDVLKEMARREQGGVVAPLPEGVIDVEPADDPSRSDPDGGLDGLL